MTGGRPRELPSTLPRIDPAIALDPALEGVQLQSRAAMLAETRRRRRLEKKTAAAQRLASQRCRRQVEELARACDHARISAEKARERYERLAAKQEEEARRLDQLRVRVESGEQVELPDTVEALLASYLPQTFEECTPEMNHDVESNFGVQRLTMQAIQALLNDGGGSDTATLRGINEPRSVVSL